MPYFLIALGLLLAYLDYLGSAHVTAAAQLTWQEVTAGNPPFYMWLGALLLVGLIGYVPDLKPISIGFLVLIVLALLLAHTSATAQLIKDL